LDEQKPEDYDRQTLLLSATLTPAVERLAGLAMTDRVFIEVDSDENDATAKHTSFALPAKLRQHYVVVPPKLRLVSLFAFLLDKTCEGTEAKVSSWGGSYRIKIYGSFSSGHIVPKQTID
jgi:ATP-dependent RNA helicase DDX31/DBP7